MLTTEGMSAALQASVDASVAELRAALAHYRGNPRVVIDVGANVGLFSLLAVERGAELVYALEPDPINFHSLVRNVRSANAQEAVVPLRVAAACIDWSMRELYTPTRMGSGQRSLVYRTDCPYTLVPTISLWQMILALPHRVDYLKIDIEGGEWELFADPLAPFALARVDYLNLETHTLLNRTFFGDVDRKAHARQVDTATDALLAWYGGEVTITRGHSSRDPQEIREAMDHNATWLGPSRKLAPLYDSPLTTEEVK